MDWIQRHTSLVTTALLVVALGPVLAPSSVAASPSYARAYTCGGKTATIVGTRAKDHIVGTAGPDVIVGLTRPDYIDGGGGDDLICGGYGDDQLYGGTGDDRVYGQENRYGPDDDGFYGDHMYDGPGDDLYKGGNDEGYDYLSFADATSPINVMQDAGSVTGESSGNDTFRAIAGIIGTAYDDIMLGDNDASLFSGGPGNDSMTLGSGYNIGSGGPGDDVLSGGLDFDSLSGNDGADRVIGGNDDDYLYGDAGDDYLDGLAGPDWGDGGPGTDTCKNIEEAYNCELAPRAEGHQSREVDR